MRKRKIISCLLLITGALVTGMLAPFYASASGVPQNSPETFSESEYSAAPAEPGSGSSPQSEGAVESESSPQAKPSSCEVIVTRYRMYHGRPQYRHWNETNARWEDPVWIDGSLSGVKRITLYTGDTLRLKIGLVKPKYAARRVYWKSKRTKVVVAHKNGRILAKRAGIAQVVAIDCRSKRTLAKIKISVRKG